jgi:hypothetical protein
MISPQALEELHVIVNKMESYRHHLLNDVEEIGIYGVAFNVSNYIIAIEALIAREKWEMDRVQG